MRETVWGVGDPCGMSAMGRPIFTRSAAPIPPIQQIESWETHTALETMGDLE